MGNRFGVGFPLPQGTMTEADKNEEAKQESASGKEDAQQAKPSTDMKSTIAMIEESVRNKEPRLMYRALRALVQMRRGMTASFVVSAVESACAPDNEKRTALLAFFPDQQADAMDVEESPSKTKHGSELIEVHVFVQLLVAIFLVDNQRIEEALGLTTELIDSLDGSSASARSLDPLTARAYFYWARCHELLGSYSGIRKRLLVAHRTATLKRNEIGQATLHNLLVRNYMVSNLLEQADHFNRKTTFPEVNPNGTARHMYYLGRIRTVQLEYSEAYMCLMQAMRKAPQNGAVGFRVTVSKLLTIVQLLMGEVPERKFFNQVGMITDLAPYCALAGAVRLGDLGAFGNVMQEYGAGFQKDKNHILVGRLRHNVIKAGLRKLNTSYSRIPLEDVCQKLSFDSVPATECIVAKAIRDGVIDGVIDHDAGYLVSNEVADLYATNEPQEAFKKRIRFCLGIHNEAVMAMRYPEDAHKDSFETAEERLQREKEETELAQTLQDEDDDEM